MEDSLGIPVTILFSELTVRELCLGLCKEVMKANFSIANIVDLHHLSQSQDDVFASPLHGK